MKVIMPLTLQRFPITVKVTRRAPGGTHKGHQARWPEGGQNGGMTDDPFEACWYRWERADSHRRDMVNVWNDYVERQTHDFELVHEGQGVSHHARD
jgi:hypothetical protein